VKLLLTAVLTGAVCVAYQLWLNPEIRFFSKLAALQDSWSQRMDREHDSKVVVFGGSSCMFSINGEQLLKEYGLPAVNRGLAAGMGIKVPALNAMLDLRAGDTLIVALEPGSLTSPAGLPAMATEFSYVRGHSEWVTRPALGLPGSGWATSLLALRPGSYHALTLIVKLIQGRTLYRYEVGDASPSGWMRTDARAPLSGPPGHGPYLSEDAQRFLSALKDWCSEKHVRVAYSLPWAYAPTDQAEQFRKGNADILIQIAKFIPVLKGPSLGADTEPGHFADTAWHLNEQGSRLRTDELGQALKHWDLWSVQELQFLKATR